MKKTDLRALMAKKGIRRRFLIGLLSLTVVLSTVSALTFTAETMEKTEQSIVREVSRSEETTSEAGEARSGTETSEDGGRAEAAENAGESSTEEGSVEESPSEGSTGEESNGEGSVEEGWDEEGSTGEDSAEAGTTEEEPAEEGAAEEGSAKEGSVEEATEAGSAEEESSEEAAEEGAEETSEGESPEEAPMEEGTTEEEPAEEGAEEGQETEEEPTQEEEQSDELVEELPEEEPPDELLEELEVDLLDPEEMMELMLASVSGTGESLIISGMLTVDEGQPGADNLFTFELWSEDGTEYYTSTKNKASGVIEFDISNLNLENGFYQIKQVPTEAERQSHPNMNFDDRVMYVELTGTKSTPGADWLVNGKTYYVNGGDDDPIYIHSPDGTEILYAYCLQNGSQFPYRYYEVYKNEPIYTAVVPAEDFGGNTGISERKVDFDTVRKVIYHYTFHYPSTKDEWDVAENIIGHLTSGRTLSYQSELEECKKEKVPGDFTLAYLYPSGKRTSGLQAIVTGYIEGNREITGDVQFANTTSEITPVEVSIQAKKTLNGGEPGEGNIFHFKLYDSEGGELQTAQNGTNGNITFEPIPYSEAGTYTYTIREVDDGAEGVTYDKTEYTVTVTVGEEDLYDLSGNQYYSVGDGKGNYYISVSPNKKDFPVYCVDLDAASPGPTTNTSVTYTELVNPDSATLANYVTINNYGDQLADNLRKLYYYLEVHSEEYTDSQKGNLVWAATSDDYAGTEMVTETLPGIFASTEVPEEYKLILFIPNGYDKALSGRHQTLMGSVGAVQDSTVTFRNTKEEPTVQSFDVSLSAWKTLNGGTPGNHRFSFELYDSSGALLQTKQNGTDGAIDFDALSFDQPGIYTFQIKEKNDGQEGITYDSTVHTITIRLDEKDFYDLTADAYYSVKGSDGGCYISKISGQTDFPVYGIDLYAKAPTTSGGTVRYTAVQNPDSATLAGYVHDNRYGTQLAENLRKLLYYFETHNMTSNDIQYYLFGATTASYPYKDTELSAIYAEDIPADYQLVLFIPDGYVNGSYSSQQPLLGAIGARIIYSGDSSVVFQNTYAPTGDELPSTGGIGTPFVTSIGLLLMVGASVLYIIPNQKKKTGGTQKTQKK